jgi:hypothetical protein
MTAEELGEAFRQEIELQGVNTEPGCAVGNYGFRFKAGRSPSDQRQITVYVRTNGESSYQQQPNLFDPSFNALLLRAWGIAKTKSSRPSRTKYEERQQVAYYTQLDELVSMWIAFAGAEPPVNWRPLREALRAAALRSGVPAPEPEDTPIERSQPHAWKAVVEQLLSHLR